MMLFQNRKSLDAVIPSWTFMDISEIGLNYLFEVLKQRNRSFLSGCCVCLGVRLTLVMLVLCPVAM